MATTFGTYPALTQATSAGAKTNIIANVEILRSVLPPRPSTNRGVNVTPNYLPEFDEMRPSLLEQLHTEIDALEASVTTGA